MSRKVCLLISLLALAIPAIAVAYSTSGSGSRDGRVVTYFNAVRAHDWAIEQAVRAWNRSGAQVEFVPAPRDEAELLIEGREPGMDGRAETVFRGGGPQPGDSKVSVPSPAAAKGPDARFTVALIAAHELGHVLKLNHEDSGCALMNSTIVNAAPARCSQPPAGKWRCGLVERDDIEGAVSLYGGRPRTPRRYCPKDPPKPKLPPPIEPEALSSAGAVEVSASSGDLSEVTVRWVNGSSDKIEAAVVARGEERCPRRPSGGEAKTVPAEPGFEGRATFPLEPERSCYAVWSRGRDGELSRPVTAWLDAPAGPEPPIDFLAEPALSHPLGDTGVSLAWRNGDAPGLEAVLIARARGRCPDRPPRRSQPWNEPRARPRTYQRHFDLGFYPVADARRYCYAAWSRDRFGRLSPRVTAWPERVAQEDGAIVLAE